ncbi:MULTISPECIES: quercetin 2,3-dioxygenase [unclassified Niallia]|uniref:quercetin 2,3-dioxygenase n=1 Tax=unclassified Niallia TaxID=2837522 RepID=UPI001EDA5B60|nr:MULTISPECIES: quercetin 2,3-dioxygenase [unclassified Niallia]MDL0435891.1 quercetin 2,3-dioxygenase [Niallia sp. SS-2023]UPO86230.1 quercetin 2,3-dioxygenase [Niallia sp. Man26]
MNLLKETGLPTEKKPYLLRSGAGEHRLFGRQVATIMADSPSTDNIFGMVMITGGKEDSFPSHIHENTHEGILILSGRLEIKLDGIKYLLTVGDYAHIPAGTVHSYVMKAHRTRFVSYTANGEIAELYRIIGKPYNQPEYPPNVNSDIPTEVLLDATLHTDIQLKKQPEITSEVASVTSLPDSAIPYVIYSGEGDRLLTGDQLHRIITSQKNTDGQFIIVASDGPAGDRIVEHYHEHHTETFFCLEGKMTMWADGQEIEMLPGDFLHVPAGTVHSYRLDSHYTKMVGLLASGLFEPFFRILGDDFEHYTFPSEAMPLRFDRVIENLDVLDLKVVNKPK